MVSRFAREGAARSTVAGGGVLACAGRGGAGAVWTGTRLLALGILTAVSVGGSCRQPMYTSDYERLVGRIIGLHAETSELSVELTEPAAGFSRAATAECLVTNDAEIYINDRFAQFDDIGAGDTVEMAGYRERSQRGERFIVCLASIARAEPLPPAPDLRSETTRPSASSQETQSWPTHP